MIILYSSVESISPSSTILLIFLLYIFKPCGRKNCKTMCNYWPQIKFVSTYFKKTSQKLHALVRFSIYIRESKKVFKDVTLPWMFHSKVLNNCMNRLRYKVSSQRDKCLQFTTKICKLLKFKSINSILSQLTGWWQAINKYLKLLIQMKTRLPYLSNKKEFKYFYGAV